MPRELRASWDEDRMWRGIACRTCGVPTEHLCRSPGGNPVPAHIRRRHDVVMGQPCPCTGCNRGRKAA